MASVGSYQLRGYPHPMTGFADAALEDIDLLKSRSDGVKQALAWFRRRHATRSAAQQSQAEPVLQPAYRVAQRGLRYAELGRGFREATLLRDGQESQQVVQIATLHLSSQLITACGF